MRVAIVGAGISGVVAGAHLDAAGIDVTVFERSSEAGGVWLYDERLPPEPAYPSIVPSEADFRDIEEHDVNGVPEKKWHPAACEDVTHAPPGLMKLKINSWPVGTEDFVNHRVLNEYIQGTSRKSGVHSKTLYNTRVERIFKSKSLWHVQTSTLTRKHGDFWKDKRNWNVLLIGAGVSSTDIARELSTEAKKIYQTSRGGAFDLPASLLPPNATRIPGEICTFESLPVERKKTQLDTTLEPIPGQVVFKDGRILTDIHRVILCTGYHMSLPFLRQYHDDATPAPQASDTVLITDGTQFHNLHKDIFYIPDPSLIFIGVPFFTATFSLFEFQAIAVAAVLSGKASLPSVEDMRSEYQQRVARNGVGKRFHSLMEREVEYVDELVGWVNRDGGKVGKEVVEGHTKAWHEANVERLERKRRVFGGVVEKFV